MLYTKEITMIEKEKFSLLDTTNKGKTNFYITGLVDGIIFDTNFKYTKKIKYSNFTLLSISINGKEIKDESFFKFRDCLEDNPLEFQYTKGYICLTDREKLYKMIDLYF